MLKLRHKLVTKFHRDLASDKWLANLASHLQKIISNYPEYHTSDGTGTVYSIYNEDRYMGPRSVCKFVFEVDCEVERVAGSSETDKYSARLKYQRKTNTFQVDSESIETKETKARDEEIRQTLCRLATEIAAGCERRVVDSFRCPWCGSKIRVSFHPSGTTFSLGCAGNLKRPRAHSGISIYEETSTPPSWWRDEVGAWLDSD